MQAQFEEFRTASEFMFNTEILKLEDELSLQSLRYEHEIMYIIQAKDKFYTDMMVSKDAKIMNLIEGSDMQSLMQKHELVRHMICSLSLNPPKNSTICLKLTGH